MSAAVTLTPDAGLRARAEALALVQLALVIHDRRRREVDDAISALATTLQTAVDAREAYAAAGETLLDATRLLARLKDGAW